MCEAGALALYTLTTAVVLTTGIIFENNSPGTSLDLPS